MMNDERNGEKAKGESLLPVPRGEDYSTTHQCTAWTITTFSYADSKIHYPS